MSVVLTMIVKNEAATIKRCIESTRDHIDHIVISDTGSTDDTVAIIHKTAAELNIPCEVHEREWVNFGHNRTEVVSLALDKADYILMVDADQTLEAEPEAFKGLTADAYHVPIKGYAANHSTLSLLSTKFPWRYEGVVHEYSTCDSICETQQLSGAALFHHADGGAREGRHLRDVVLLEEEHTKNPSDPRTCFYLAQTYKDLGRNEEARKMYLTRANLGGWPEETYCAFLYAGRLGEGYSAFLKAAAILPNRLEATYELALHARMAGAYHVAYKLSSGPAELPNDLLFVEQWIYDWGMLFEHSINAYWAGNHAEALDECDQLLRADCVPPHIKLQVAKNREFSEAALQLL